MFIAKKQGLDDKVFDIIVNVMVILATIITIYPLYYVLLASVSSPAVIGSGKLLLWPSETDLGAYNHILNDLRIWRGYYNTINYTVFGTLFGVVLTILGGYSLSRKDLVGRDLIMKLLVFTMYFNGGLIPTYIIVKGLHMVNSPSVMIILGSFTVFNLIIVRTFFMAKIPDELLEAANIDGCGNGRFFFSIVLPLSKEIVSVIVLYIAVSHWNAFFNALIYLSSQQLYPLQLVLREILVASQSISGGDMDAAQLVQMQRLAQTIKYGVIVVATVPVLALYPFLQKYFIRGVMIGSIKG